jgi:hypothetical protein
MGITSITCMAMKAIKNVSEEAWSEFKALADMRALNLGECFEELVRNAKTGSSLPRRSFHEILTDLEKKPLLSPESARTVRRRIVAFRKGFKMRS